MRNPIERFPDGEFILRLGPIRFWRHAKHLVNVSKGWISWELHFGKRVEVKWFRAKSWE